MPVGAALHGARGLHVLLADLVGGDRKGDIEATSAALLRADYGDPPPPGPREGHARLLNGRTLHSGRSANVDTAPEVHVSIFA